MRSFAGSISLPSAYAILMLVIVLGAALTWMLPAGRYDLLRYDQAHRVFVAERATGEEPCPVSRRRLTGWESRFGSSTLKKATFENRSQFLARITLLRQTSGPDRNSEGACARHL